jgi:hypothetical protein
LHDILRHASGRVNRFGPRGTTGEVNHDDPVTRTPSEINSNGDVDNFDINLALADWGGTAVSGELSNDC